MAVTQEASSPLNRVIRVFDSVLDLLAACTFAGMMLVLCLQIFFRYVLEEPLVWATPLSLFLFIWATWLGGAAGIRDRMQVRVELAEHFLPRRVLAILMPAITAACALFMLLVVQKSFRIVELNTTAIYDTLPFTRAYLFMVVPVVGSVIFLLLIRVFLAQIREYFPQARMG